MKSENGGNSYEKAFDFQKLIDKAINNIEVITNLKDDDFEDIL